MTNIIYGNFKKAKSYVKEYMEFLKLHYPEAYKRFKKDSYDK